MKIIKTEGKTKLVEYIDDNGLYKRCILPVEEEDVKLGMPYGLPFEEFVNHPAISNELRRRGIWTLNDLMKKQQAAYGAVQAAYGQDLATIIRKAKEEKND